MSKVNLDEPVAVNRPVVVSETIDGEAIIMHHASGHYFNTAGPGAVIWQAIENAASPTAIVQHLVAGFEVDENQAQAALERFLRSLEGHDLIRYGGETVVVPFQAPPVRAPFSEPLIDVHTDLADMLLLDPIHDVDEVGWPAPAPSKS